MSAKPWHGPGHGSDPGSYHAGRHAFVMTGKATVFLTHLTMLHMEEHMYELVLRARLPYEAMAQYREESAAHPEVPYFLANVERDLLTVPQLQIGRRTSFLGEVYRGIPEPPDDGKYQGWPWTQDDVLIPDVETTVDRVVAFRHFDLTFEYPPTLTYLLFGAGDEAHLCHHQTKEQDFDQVVTLKEAPDWLPAEKLEAGANVNFPSIKHDPPHCSDPLVNSTYDVQYCGSHSSWKIAIDRNVWFSTNITNSDDRCRKAE